MKGTYLGMDDKAHKVRKMYIGIDDTTRKVKRADIGVKGIARLFYTSDFFIAKGLTLDNVIAAYQFKGVKTEEESKKNLTGNDSYDLTYSNVSWDITRGLKSGTVTNNALAALGTQIKTQIVCYANYSLASGSTLGLPHYVLTYMKPLYLVLRNTWRFHSHNAPAENFNEKGHNRPGFITEHHRNTTIAGDGNGGTWIEANSGTAPSSGVIGGSFANKLYLNGVQVQSSVNTGMGYVSVQDDDDLPIASCTDFPNSDSNRVVVPKNGNGWNVDIIAAAFFNCYLTDAQHLEIANSMRDIK